MSRGFGGRVPWSTGWRLRNLSKEMVVDIERLWMGGGEQYAREVLRRGERKHFNSATNSQNSGNEASEQHVDKLRSGPAMAEEEKRMGLVEVKSIGIYNSLYW